MKTNSELLNLAVRLRCNSNIACCDMRDAIGALGGEIAIQYGALLMIPQRWKLRHWTVRHKIADLIDHKAINF